MNTIGEKVAILSRWIDDSYERDGFDLDGETVLRRRIDKLMEEVGEVGQALGGYVGENPRKGFTHEKEDVMAELLDVAITALGAWEHMGGNRGDSGEALEDKLYRVLNRVGLVGPQSVNSEPS
jgi:NTP pyrophosphatase (non-canonical NTP hydrolase)